MADHSFIQFFSRMSDRKGERKPYPYQSTLATGRTIPDLLTVPTGAGKTLAVLAAWLYRRRYHPDVTVRAATPRRLVYCLPMRVLVEQTRDVARGALENLGLLADSEDLLDQDPGRVGVHVLIGGELDREFVAHPERDTVLVGTQDMLLSRALNRGYSESRYRWPLSFALVSNDSLWVLDEVQLMGAGLPTSCQLAAFRREWKTFGPSHTLWMSATVTPEALATVDHPAPAHVLTLTEEDRRDKRLSIRLNAKKKLTQSATTFRKASGKELDATLAGLAAQIREKHRPGTLTIAIMNTVARARQLYRTLTATQKGRKPATAAGPAVLLIHSRFRPEDRQGKLEQLLAPPPAEGTICVATQVVEAGVDVSARCLFTELAPWPSLVQRFGRCNRTGEDDDAEVLWVDVDTGDRETARPYDPRDLDVARRQLLDLDDVGPQHLGPVELQMQPTHVPRRRDVMELFDTTPDISGGDIDVSRFVRDTDDRTLQVFWRNLKEKPSRDLLRPERVELCSAPLAEVRELIERTSRNQENGWVWDVLEGSWVPVDRRRLRPGLVVLLRTDLGGYSPDGGWTPDASEKVASLEPVGGQPEAGADDDEDTFWNGAGWVGLSVHLDDVEKEAATICGGLSLDEDRSALVATAARWHDAGKAHSAFQHTLTKMGGEPGQGPWAKSPHRARHTERPRLRHELASALALLANADSALPGLSDADRDLVAYLVAAHHGRVRLAIRSVPGEKSPPEGLRYALGVWDGDELPASDLGGGVRLPATKLTLDLMALGLDDSGSSTWTDRVLSLLESLGPFRLAYLEALVIAADWRGSERAKRRNRGSGDGHA